MNGKAKHVEREDAVKRRILNAVLHISSSTFNNTIVTITDTAGNADFMGKCRCIGL